MALSKRGKTALAATAIAVLVAAAVIGVLVVVYTTKNKNQNKKWSNLANDLIAPWKKIRPKFIPDPDWGPGPSLPNINLGPGPVQESWQIVPVGNTTCGATGKVPRIDVYNGSCTGGLTKGPGSACEYATYSEAQSGCDADGASACSGVIVEKMNDNLKQRYGLVDATTGYRCVKKGTANIYNTALYQKTF